MVAVEALEQLSELRADFLAVAVAEEGPLAYVRRRATPAQAARVAEAQLLFIRGEQNAKVRTSWP